jgi:hypothetical protein
MQLVRFWHEAVEPEMSGAWVAIGGKADASFH